MTKEKKVAEYSTALSVSCGYSLQYNEADSFILCVMEYIYSEYKKNLIKELLNCGADEAFINSVVTDEVIHTSILNNLSAESVAWALMQ